VPKKNRSTAARSFLLGAVSGSRSAMPLAVLAWNHERRAARGTWQQWGLFRSPTSRAVLATAAAGEVVGDKLPATPARTSRGALIGRVVSGMVAGAALGTARKSTTGLVVGAVLGGIGAAAGTYATYYTRKGITAVGVPDRVVAVAEDVAALTSARAIVRGV
jgi:uncharacterized membrane protein